MNPLIAHTPNHFPLCGIFYYQQFNDGLTPPIKPIKPEFEFCPTVMMELLPSWDVYICYDFPKFKLFPMGWLRPIQF